MYRLINPVRPYAWGSKTAIADFFQRPASGKPEAELWLGAHPTSPSLVALDAGDMLPLDSLIGRDPVHALGQEVAETYESSLPFLAKMLAAETPLSLQVHPTREQAKSGYAKEESAGIALDSPQRIYKDTNHKPEMIVALSPFEALCGFRTPKDSQELFGAIAKICKNNGEVIPVVHEVIKILDLPHAEYALREAFGYLIAGTEDIRDAVDQVARQLSSLSDPPTPLSEVVTLQRQYPGDPGVLISLLLNHVTLEAGQALCLPAGNIHAYLRGLGFEVMASSDNVVRGGLTPKHIDIPELLRTVDFRPLPLPLLEPVLEAGTRSWIPPFEEFRVQHVEVFRNEATTLRHHGPAIVLAVTGQGEISTTTTSLTLTPGNSLFVPAGDSPIALSCPDDSPFPFTAFLVTVGLPPDQTPLGSSDAQETLSPRKAK